MRRASSVYVPAATPLMAYRPCSSVSARNRVPTTVTCVPLSPRPSAESVTVPVILPEPCACAAAGSHASEHERRAPRSLSFDIRPPEVIEYDRQADNDLSLHQIPEGNDGLSPRSFQPAWLGDDRRSDAAAAGARDRR